MKNYSSNDELKNLAQNLGFTIYLFDDPQTVGPEIKLREKSKDCELDAIMLYQNLVFLVSINSGHSSNLEAEVKTFFDKLDGIKEINDTKFEINITKKKKKQLENKEKFANEQLEKINAHIKATSADYNIIIKKLFFAPNKEIDEEFVRRERNDGKIVIDKDCYQYFSEVLNRLNKQILFNDFMHFLEIKKSDLEKKGTSRTGKPGKSGSYKVDRIELKKDKIIMYSFSPRVEDLSNYATVLRLSQKYDKKGFQRIIRPKRLENIDTYLENNETFPNNIIIFLNPAIYKNEKDFYGNGELTLLDEFNSLIIIDGQHRFFSFVKGNKLNRFILVTLVFLRENNESENYSQMEKMFYKINKTQERIDPNISFILQARIGPDSEENFWYQVFKKLDKPGHGFFSERFSLKERAIKINDNKRSIISVIKYGGITKLNKEIKKKKLIIEGLNTLYSGQNRDNNIEFAFILIKNYFDIIEKVLYNQKVNKESLTPREIGALFKLFRHFIVTNKEMVKRLGSNHDITKSKDQTDIETVSYFEGLLTKIPFQEVIALNYSASNWAAIEAYMLKKINSSDQSFGNRLLLSKKGKGVYDSLEINTTGN